MEKKGLQIFRHRKRFIPPPRQCVWNFALVALVASMASAAPAPVFGPESFVRQTGQPVAIQRTFRVADPAATSWLLHLDNGGSNGQFPATSHAVVTLNNVQVIGPSDINP